MFKYQVTHSCPSCGNFLGRYKGGLWTYKGTWYNTRGISEQPNIWRWPPVLLFIFIFSHLCTCPPPLPTITTNFQEPWRPSHHNLMNYAIFSFSKSHALGFRPGSICLYIQDARTERSGQEKIFYPRSVNQHFLWQLFWVIFWTNKLLGFTCRIVEDSLPLFKIWYSMHLWCLVTSIVHIHTYILYIDDIY